MPEPAGIEKLIDDRHYLKRHGFNRPFLTQFGPSISAVIIIVMAIGAGVLVHIFKDAHAANFSEFQAVTAVVTMGAFVLAFQQWRATRQEISLDKFYERLDRANRLLADCKSARELMNPDWKDDAAGISFEQTMYIFMELDNLEYAIEKYATGYMSTRNAIRALKTFVSRCEKSPNFGERALIAAEQFGYNKTTTKLVSEILFDRRR